MYWEQNHHQVPSLNPCRVLHRLLVTCVGNVAPQTSSSSWRKYATSQCGLTMFRHSHVQYSYIQPDTAPHWLEEHMDHLRVKPATRPQGSRYSPSPSHHLLLSRHIVPPHTPLHRPCPLSADARRQASPEHATSWLGGLEGVRK